MDTSSLNHFQEDLKKWEQEPGYVSINKSQTILDQLNKDNNQDKRMAAKVYGLLARDRLHQRLRFDPLVKNWMSKGIRLNEQEPILLQLSAQEQLEQIRDSLFSLPLPLLRETDQSSARKKAASQLNDISEKELYALHKAKENVQTFHTPFEKWIDEKNFSIETLLEIMDSGTEKYTKLQDATEEYLQTASGSYYSPEQVKEIKQTVNDLMELKDKWNALMEEYTPFTSTENPLDELNRMIGLERVKNRVSRMYHYLQYQKQRKEKGYQLHDERSLHMILTGNPGTGKTMLARLLAKIYHELGLLQRDEVLEADRSQLVGGYVGQTEEKTMRLVKESVGGILFIDEAYSLKREGMTGNDFGQTAIDTLVSAMTSGEYAGTFAVILAGYPEEMRQFLRSNPGLRSRFPESNHIHLPDYTMNELTEIAEKTAFDNDFIISSEGKKELVKRLETEQVDESFGNARTAKNIIMDAIFQKGARIGAQPSNQIDDYALLTKEDMKDPSFNEKPEKGTSSMEKLESLVGLKDVKHELKKLTSFIQIQKKRRKSGKRVAPIQLHTVFAGPPGTGKTTVAQLYADILKELGLLKRGHLLVCGRSDLVAEYTGQTAMKTRKKVREALGGVLFIDEAYSLAAPGRGDFGREALDTLVEEMTKHEENLVIILSGYPEPIRQLFQTNPGLDSRFKKYFYFPSYEAEELAYITRSYIAQYGYRLENGVEDKLIENYKKADTSGNARFAEDIAEELFQQQARRLEINNHYNSDELNLLTLQDIKAAFAYKKQEREREQVETIRDQNRS